MPHIAGHDMVVGHLALIRKYRTVDLITHWSFSTASSRNPLCFVYRIRSVNFEHKFHSSDSYMFHLSLEVFRSTGSDVCIVFYQWISLLLLLVIVCWIQHPLITFVSISDNDQKTWITNVSAKHKRLTRKPLWSIVPDGDRFSSLVGHNKPLWN